MITYNRNKDLGELTRSHTLQGRKVFIKTFESYQTNGTFKIFHKLNCKSSFVIYLMECTLCLIKYVGKAGKPFNIRQNNHRQNANGNNSKAIPASTHFKQPGHNFNKQTCKIHSYRTN